MTQHVQSRAPKNVATALAGTVSQIVSQVVAEDGAPKLAVSVRENHPAGAEDALSAIVEAQAPVAPATTHEAHTDYVRVTNGHMDVILGLAPGETAHVLKSEAAKYAWAWTAR